MKSKTAVETAKNLIDIFCLFGAPSILHSNNGREFANQIINNLKCQWSNLKIVHGKPRHSHSQGSVERCNRDIRDALICWMADENTRHWADGLCFVQSKKNRSYHSAIKRSPYEAMFGCAQRNGLKDTDLPQDLVDSLESESDLVTLLSEVTEVQHPTEKSLTERTEAVAGADEGAYGEEVQVSIVDGEMENTTNSEVQSFLEGEEIENIINKEVLAPTVDIETEGLKINENGGLLCIVCKAPVADVQSCSKCEGKIHASCSVLKVSNEFESEFQCFLCQRSCDITINREHAKRGLEVQANLMLAQSTKKI
ncbi:hypothetical protein NQ315_017368 [Exocentrus adspersus]|uniref:Integrase catalytic domain-containing protein n=1 Tax=Exocentrus adspersus TaxID=1586481 RepID=A0AAV8VJZ6_9CUCU|nr:hypothetical protein NQ315_017368 [Exocentrus adspersus]